MKLSNVYLSGSTSSDEGIATPDGFLTTNAATGFWPNAFLVRFNSSNQGYGVPIMRQPRNMVIRAIVRVDTIYMAGPTYALRGLRPRRFSIFYDGFNKWFCGKI